MSRAGFVLLALVAPIVLLVPTHADPDLFGHVLFGLDILRDRSLAERDPYAYTTGEQTWFNHEWLAEIAFALAWRAGGDAGLIALKVACGALVLGLLFASMLRRGLPAHRAAGVLLVAMIAIAPGWTVRPQMFTFVGFALVALAIERGTVRSVLALVPVFALWVNVHGGFLAGAGLLFVWVAARAAEDLVRTRRLPWGLLAASLAAASASLANPYGARHLLFLFRTATVARPEISEWAALKFPSVPGASWAVLAFFGALALHRSRRPVAFSTVAAFAVAALLPLVAARHLALFGIAAVVLTARALPDLWPAGDDPPPRGRGAAVAGALSAAAAIALAGATIWQGFLTRIRIGQWDYPVRAVTRLDESGAKGNLAIDFDWGEYAIWHLAPDVRVSLDGRRETVYSPREYGSALAFQYGLGDWDRLLDQGTDLALVRRRTSVDNLMRLRTGWVLVHEDDLSALFAREGWDGLERLRAVPARLDLPADGHGLGFPAGPTRR